MLPSFPEAGGVWGRCVGAGLDPKRWSNVIFGGLFAVSLFLFWRVIAPFVMPVLLGGFLTVLFMPLQDFFARRWVGKRSLVAGASTFVVFLVLLAPIAVIGYLVARELLSGVAYAKDVLEHVDLRTELLQRLPRALRRHVAADFDGETGKAVLGALSGGAGAVTRLLGAGTQLVLNLFLMTVSMYYFFLDGRRLVAEAARLIPMDQRYTQAFMKEFKDVAYAIVWGNTLTAVVQGAVGFVGMLLAGVPSPVVWGVAMVLVALIPVGGTALVWGPVGVGLIVTGQPTHGVFLLGWGLFAVSTIDNVVRPRLTGSRMKLHPLLVFLSMFGGLAVFGMMGILVGPLIAALFMAMVRIYRRDFLVPTTAIPSVTVGPPPASESVNG